MTSRATTEIEAYINAERHKVLLDVAKYLLSGVMANPNSWDSDHKYMAEDVVDAAESLIKEVESR